VAQIRVILKLIYIIPSTLCRREQSRVNAVGYTYKLVFRRYMVHILGGLSSISTAGCQCILSVFEAKFRGTTSQPVPEHPCLWTIPPDAVLPYAVLSNSLNLYIPIINTSITVRYTLTVWSFVVSICTTCSNIKQLYVFTTTGYLPVQHHFRNKHTRTYIELIG